VTGRFRRRSSLDLIDLNEVYLGNWVVILVEGFGVRFRPLTQHFSEVLLFLFSEKGFALLVI